MAFEIDYIPVGENNKSGDAIALRFGNLSGAREEQTVIVIDGGFKESGEKLVEHIRTYYDTNRVDLVISTHPDADHTSGLSVVLEELSVGRLVMHRPWEHAEDIKELFNDGRVTASGLEKRLEDALQNAKDLETLAIKKGIAIVEPFQGATGYNNIIHVLGPSKEYYQSLLTGFRSTPGPVSGTPNLVEILRKALEGVVRFIEDSFFIDLLDNDEDSTSAENNSSTIILFQIDGQKLLFTGDAGKTALLNAIEYAGSMGISLTDMNFLDVPHHGSKRNLSSKILKKMNAANAYISASASSEKHPSKKVTNALHKVNSRVFVNRANTICYRHNAPPRLGWGPIIPEPFHSQVEE